MDRQKNVKIWFRETDSVLYEGGLPANPRLKQIESAFSIEEYEERVLLRPTSTEVFVDVYQRDGTPIPTTGDGYFELPDSVDIMLTIEETDEMIILTAEFYEGVSVMEWFRETTELQLDEHPDLVPLSSDRALDVLFDESVGQEEPLETTTDLDREKLEKARARKAAPRSNRWFFLAGAIVVVVIVGFLFMMGIRASQKNRLINEVQSTYNDFYENYATTPDAIAPENPYQARLNQLLANYRQQYPDETNPAIENTQLNFLMLQFQQQAVQFVSEGDLVGLSLVTDDFRKRLQDYPTGLAALDYTTLVTEFQQFHLRWPKYPKWSDQVPGRAEINAIKTKVDSLSSSYREVQQLFTLLLADIDHLGRFAINNIAPKAQAWSEFWEDYDQAQTQIGTGTNPMEYFYIRYPNLKDQVGHFSSQPELLRFAISASGRTASEGGSIIDEFQPLVRYMRDAGLKVVLDVSTSYHEILAKLLDEQVELAILNQRAGLDRDRTNCARPVMARTWRGATYVDCYLYTRTDSDINDIIDLQNATFSFTNYDLTTGYAMPLLYVAELGYDPREIFQKSYFAGGTFAAIGDVISGKADACAADEQTIFLAQQSGLDVSSLRKFENIGLRPMSTFNVRSDLASRYEDRLRQILSQVEPGDLFTDANPELHPYASWGPVNFDLQDFFFTRMSLLVSNEHARLGLDIDSRTNSALADSLADHIKAHHSRVGLSIVLLEDNAAQLEALTQNLIHQITAQIWINSVGNTSVTLRLNEIDTGQQIARRRIEGSFGHVLENLPAEIQELVQLLPLRAEVSAVPSPGVVTVTYNTTQETRPNQTVYFYRSNTSKLNTVANISRDTQYVKIGEGKILKSQIKKYTATFVPLPELAEIDTTLATPQPGDLAVTATNDAVALTP